ncbi:bifunctional DNA-formamidopyrimidine glycosylase/DNA-(apurinic or apyrimidinic site) lyase [Demequina sp. NBRC 110051]|uniref:bifunctional DNA-formamidopyrimidine glycosylase/DNA-(apurinic or apyrimidinic site) lyase n=1 Tax=Demequina sp. NBRC 110051 TaxID=1570340 RepID=UPI0009FE64D0|nr:bifunctional DNA-formamidopyrimidine glycosylase/DNA-(apurinic or apyrimidinic site) lyase [Demequina sp. NBRC 110051]
MPELPEVETVRAGLAPFVTDATVTSVEVRRESVARLLPGGGSEFAARLAGATITGAVRRGKFLWLPLRRSEDPADAGASESLSAHLGMSGQFRVHTAADAPEPHPHCRARMTLHRAGEDLVLDFLDQRTFGYLHVEDLLHTPDGLPGGHGMADPQVPLSVAHIGRDALDPHLDARAASRAWRTGRRGIKQLLLDQTLVSGIGNIYADEALWLARVNPERPAHAVNPATASALLSATQDVMRSALAQGGTSFDALYVNVNGQSGYFARGLEAYGRGGEPCRRCGHPLRRETIGGRSTHWCATCQRRYSPRRAGAH